MSHLSSVSHTETVALDLVSSVVFEFLNMTRTHKAWPAILKINGEKLLEIQDDGGFLKYGRLNQFSSCFLCG